MLTSVIFMKLCLEETLEKNRLNNLSEKILEFAWI